MAREAELRLREQLSKLKSLPLLRGARLEGELERLQRQLDRLVAAPTDEAIWHSVQLARKPDRPHSLDYVERLIDDWFELHGDRHHGDDPAVIAAVTPTRMSTGASEWPIPRVLERRCVRWSSLTGTVFR